MWRRVQPYPQLKCVQGQKIKLGGDGVIVTVEVCKRVRFPLGSCFCCIPQPTLNNNLDGVCIRSPPLIFVLFSRQSRTFDSIIMFSIAENLQYPIANDDFSKQIAVFIPSSPAVIKHPLPCFRSNLEKTKKLERELLYPSSYLIHDFGKDKTFQIPVVRCKRFYDNEPLKWKYYSELLQQ